MVIENLVFSCTDKDRTFVTLLMFFQDKMSYLLGMSDFGVCFAAWVDDER